MIADRSLSRPRNSPSIEPPTWLDRLLFQGTPRRVDAEEPTPGLQLRVVDHHDVCLVSVEVPEALALGETEFEEAVVEAYRHLLDALHDLDAKRPVRLWNFIPNILEPLGSQPHRYMTFNAGRYRAFSERYSAAEFFPSTLATASGTGNREGTLVLHCLSSVRRGAPIENPRQVPAYLYSRKYGARPPCFARATRWRRSPGEAPWLLVGGTASVRGEDSVHVDDLAGQTRETMVNLSALLGAALMPEEDRDDHPFGILRHFRELRVYHPEREARAEIEMLLEAWFPDLDELQLVQADLCRPELLIEIEGLAELPETDPSP